MEKSNNLIYRAVRGLVKAVYPVFKTEGQDNIPQEPCIVVMNHCQMNGPIASELYFPGQRYIWCAEEMMHLKEVPAYSYKDFWSKKPAYIRWFYKLLSYIIAPLSVCIFNNAHTVAVYRDRRIMHTFKETVQRLTEGANVIVFPEHDQPHNNILCNFQEGFVDIARLYYRQTGKSLKFLPVYLAPGLKTMYCGKPVAFSPDSPIKEERKRICVALMDEISSIAHSLPRHRVVPYNNMPKSQYPYNIEAGDNI